MSNLLRFDPFFTAFQPLFSAAAAPRTVRRRAEAQSFAPHLEIRETETDFVLVADMPGVSEDAVDISVEGRELSISGARERAELGEADKVHVHERAFGSFSRKFNLPDEVDADSISAKLEHGVLTLRIPKVPQSQPRKIRVRGAADLRDTA